MLAQVEPGDRGTCTYTITYAGTVPARVHLDVTASSRAAAATTPAGSMTPLGDEGLIPGGGDVHGMRFSLGDTLGNTLTVPRVTCPQADSGTAGAQEGSGPLRSASACNGRSTEPLLDKANTQQPAGAWAPGQSDTITLSWHLPRSAPNTYEGSATEIVLQASATEALSQGQDGPEAATGQIYLI